MSWTLLLTAWAPTLCVVGYLCLDWRKRFISPEVSKTNWAIGYVFSGLGLWALLICFPISLFHGAPLAAGLMIPVILLGFLGWKILAHPLTVVRSSPSEVAVFTFWTTRYEVLFAEGEYKLLPFFPFKQGIATATRKTIPVEFIFDSVPCKSDTGADGKGVGAYVVVRVVGNIEADHMLNDKDARGNAANPSEGARRIINFLDKGGNDGIVNGLLVNAEDNGVLKTLRGGIGEDVREHAQNYTWEEYTALKAPLAASLLARICNELPRQLPRNADGLVVKPDRKKYTTAAYLALPQISEPLAYVCKANNNSDEGKMERRNRIIEMDFFLDMVHEGGFADVPSLGIQFTHFYVPDIEPVGAVKEAANKAAAEKKQREQEVADTDAEIALARQYIAADSKLTMQEALSYVRMRRNPSTRELFIHGSTSTLTDAAAINALAKG